MAPKRRGTLDAAAAQKVSLKAKENAKKANANKAKADKAKAAKSQATTTAKATARAHSSETRVAPTAALLTVAGLMGGLAFAPSRAQALERVQMRLPLLDTATGQLVPAELDAAVEK